MSWSGGRDAASRPCSTMLPSLRDSLGRRSARGPPGQCVRHDRAPRCRSRRRRGQAGLRGVVIRVRDGAGGPHLGAAAGLADLDVRGDEALRRVLLPGVHLHVWLAHRGAPLLQRLRPQAGSRLRVCGGDPGVRDHDAPRGRAHRVRRRAADPRLRLRRRCRRGERPGRPGTEHRRWARVQHRARARGRSLLELIEALRGDHRPEPAGLRSSRPPGRGIRGIRVPTSPRPGGSWGSSPA